MPFYEYSCRTCGTRFEERRPMAEANDPAVCPAGHDGAVRMLSVFASVGSLGSAPQPGPGPSGGGCCGGGCCS